MVVGIVLVIVVIIDSIKIVYCCFELDSTFVEVTAAAEADSGPVAVAAVSGKTHSVSPEL